MKSSFQRHLRNARNFAGRHAYRVRAKLTPNSTAVLKIKQRSMYWSVNGAFDSILGQGLVKITMPPGEALTVRIKDPGSGHVMRICYDNAGNLYHLETPAGDGWKVRGEFKHLMPTIFRALRHFLEESPKHRVSSWENVRSVFMPMDNGKPVPKCIRIGDQWTSQLHRSGWHYGLEALECLHSEQGVHFDGFVESTFLWGDSGRVYRKPWIGVIHNPPNTPAWAAKGTATNEYLFQTDRWKKSFGHCKGIFVLSEYHRLALVGRLKIPVSVIRLPSETPQRTFSIQSFRNNAEPMLIQIGNWLRNPNSLHKLATKRLTKVRLDTGHPWEEDVRSNLPPEKIPAGTVRVLPYVSNEEYDELLARNVVFLDLFDSSANNAIVECVVRNTPLLVNRHPAVVEYLGDNYPLYFRTLDEAEKKAGDFNLIERAHRYLQRLDKERFSQKGFLRSVIESEVYRSLLPTATRPFVILALPRSGSTPLMEILDVHDGIRMLNEPFHPERSSWGEKGVFHAYRQDVTDLPTLDSCLDEIFSYHTGIKHLVDQLKDKESERLLERDCRRIFLHRKNLLQAAVSGMLVDRAGGMNDRKHTDGNAILPALDIKEISDRISRQRKMVERYRNFFQKKNLPYYEITCEEIFGPETGLDEKVRRILDIYRFLRAPEPTEAVKGRVRELLDSAQRDRMSEEKYRLIPNVDEIETKLGSTENGFIFQRTAAGRKAPAPPVRWPSHSPFAAPSAATLIIHGCYHKTGTHWLMRILTQIAGRWDLRFASGREIDPSAAPDIFFDPHSRFDISALPAFRGSHMIRDPRDIVVSGYFYHLWTNESWAHIPRTCWGGLTFQDHLLSLDREEGLMAEIDRLHSQFEAMRRWDYSNPGIFELRYETLMADGEPIFRKLFEHYGFHADAVEFSVGIASASSFKARAGRSVGEVREGDVMRSGRSGQWQEHFTDRVKKHFQQSTGDLLTVLGYETEESW